MKQLVLLGVVETIRFLGCSNLLMTSSTVVFLTVFACSMLSLVKGVYEVMRKWHRGVGMSEATIPTRSLCI